jgi:hypothetical protein
MIGQSQKVVELRSLTEALPPINISLDDLLREVSPALVQAEEMRKARRQIVKDEEAEAAGTRDFCGMTKKQRLALRARVLQWEAEAEWLPQCFVALEQVDVCTGCGHSSGHIVGVYQFQQKRLSPQTRRFVLWAPEEATEARLPRTVLTTEREVALCPRCLWQQGFVEEYKGEVKP